MKGQSPRVARWLCEPLPKDVAASIKRLVEADDVLHIAVMPDVHLSGDVCVGLAVATERLLYPAAVGGDIGCGIAAVAVRATADLLAEGGAAARLLAGLSRAAPPMRHSRVTMAKELPSALSENPLSDSRLSRLADRDGRVQFGTLGRGNHFLEFQSDQDGQLWIMLHSGSRAMGQAITAHHVTIAERLSQRRKLPYLDANSAEGASYVADLAWAIRYAEESRLAMLRATEQLLVDQFGIGLDWSTLIHANHNHVRRENHFGSDVWVHRKGALSAVEGEAGMIPGSMGSVSFHATGRGCKDALCSSSHGAGRAMSRGQAAETITTRQLQREMQGIWYSARQADRLHDEAPSAYKDVEAVMRAQRDLTRIERKLRPVLSYKGS